MRTTLLTLAALSLALIGGTPGTAREDKEGHDHGKEYMTCAKACDDCARSCDACSTHCAKLVADGKKDHLTTLKTCQDCATTCRAAGAIVARKGPFSDLICKACAEVCKKCGDACLKFKSDKMMKECGDECRKCEKACRTMLKHTAH